MGNAELTLAIDGAPITGGGTSSPPHFKPPDRKGDAIDSTPISLPTGQVTDQYLADQAMTVLKSLTGNFPEWLSNYLSQEASQPTPRIKLAWRLAAIGQLLQAGVR
jgi:hypothetical protein